MDVRVETTRFQCRLRREHSDAFIFGFPEQVSVEIEYLWGRWFELVPIAVVTLIPDVAFEESFRVEGLLESFQFDGRDDDVVG